MKTSFRTVVVTAYWLIVYVDRLITHDDKCAMYIIGMVKRSGAGKLT